ncbi:MAG: hypothetical protein U9O41_07025 [Candidatus Aerophobetes bacterium]|nr:hypothetical protein [Candidatus Aerophobetes bacterium]
MQVGPVVSFYILVIFWVIRVVIITFFCSFLGWLGIRVLDALTPTIHERKKIGENPISIAFFIAGFIIFLGCIIHGVSTSPMAIGRSLLASLIDFTRLELLTINFFVSLLIAVVLFNIFNRLTPKIQFLAIKDNCIAVGIYVFSYLVFLGIVLHAALTMSL